VISNRIVAFVAFTFAISWVIWVAMVAGSISIETPVGFVLNIVAMAGPTIAALILAARAGAGTLQRLLDGFSFSRVSLRWLAVAFTLPLAMVAVAIAVSVLVFGAPTPIITVAVIGAIAVEYVRVFFFGGPLEEELGWRGYALPRLQVGLTAWRAALLLGLVWGLWHLPLYFVPGTGQQETAAASDVVFAFVAFVIWTMGLSVLFTWLFNETGGSVLVVMVLHASVNVGSFVPAAVGSTGAASFLYALLTWIVALLVAWRLGSEHLASRPRVVETDAADRAAPA
jgi:uncharacterized protein